MRFPRASHRMPRTRSAPRRSEHVLLPLTANRLNIARCQLPPWDLERSNLDLPPPAKVGVKTIAYQSLDGSAQGRPQLTRRGLKHLRCWSRPLHRRVPDSLSRRKLRMPDADRTRWGCSTWNRGPGASVRTRSGRTATGVIASGSASGAMLSDVPPERRLSACSIAGCAATVTASLA